MHRLIALTGALLVACGGAGSPPNVCTPPACTPATSSYAVEIIGNANSTFPATELTQVSLDGTSGVLTLSLAASAQVTGHVTSAGTPVPASVVFSRPSLIPGRPDVSYQASVSPTDGSYAISVPPNVGSESYVVRVRPTDNTTYPPITVTKVITDDTTVELTLPFGEQLIHFHGTLANAVSVGVAQATVVLRDATNLNDLSTTTTTSADGSFEVAISSAAATGADGVVLVADQGDASTGLITLALPVSSDQIVQSATTVSMALQLPALPATTHLSIPVVGTASNGTVEPVVGATFRVYAPLGLYMGGQSIEHEVDGQTDANGKIQADLFSGSNGARTYYVTVVPPSGSDFEAPSVPFTLSVGTASGVVAPLMLATRPLITGSVLDPTGTALKGATVQPTLSTILASQSALTSATPASTTTDGTGRFALRLDPGTYDFDVSPPATASLPRRWLSRQVITGDFDVGTARLSSAVMFDVRLEDSSQMPVQATVRLYVVQSSDPDCSSLDMGTGCVATPQLQAEVATANDGTATMLLPAKATADMGTVD